MLTFLRFSFRFWDYSTTRQSVTLWNRTVNLQRQFSTSKKCRRTQPRTWIHTWHGKSVSRSNAVYSGAFQTFSTDTQCCYTENLENLGDTAMDSQKYMRPSNTILSCWHSIHWMSVMSFISKAGHKHSGGCGKWHQSMLKRYGSCCISMERDLSIQYNLGHWTWTNVLQRIQAKACCVTWNKALQGSIWGIQDDALQDWATTWSSGLQWVISLIPIDTTH